MFDAQQVDDRDTRKELHHLRHLLLALNAFTKPFMESLPEGTWKRNEIGGEGSRLNGLVRLFPPIIICLVLALPTGCFLPSQLFSLQVSGYTLT